MGKKAKDKIGNKKAIETTFQKMEMSPEDVLIINIETEGKYGDPKIAEQINAQVNNIHQITKHDKILVVLDQTTSLEVLPEAELNALGYYRLKEGEVGTPEAPEKPSQIVRI